MTNETVVNDVIQLKAFRKPAPEEEMVLVCATCECRSFMAMSTGRLECAHCKSHVEPNVEWRKQLPDVTGNEEEESISAYNIAVLGDPKFARLGVMKKIEQRKEEVAAIYAVYESGETTAWIGAETSEQRDYLVGKFEEIVQHMKTGDYKD